MYIRRLFSFFSRTKRDKKAMKQKSPFFDLPLALVYDIFDELPLAEKVLLSQTCRDLWYKLRCKYSSAMAKATAVERLECRTILGDILPDHQFCTSCRSLHLLDPKGLPVTGYERFSHPCPGPKIISKRDSLIPCYSITFHRVQLAIQHNRLKGVHQDYCASIMQRFTTSVPRYYSMQMHISADPVVIDGRFILMTIYNFHTAGKPMSSMDLSQAHLQICPHLGAGSHVITDNPLLAAIRSAPNRCRYGCSRGDYFSCDRCPTDFHMQFTAQVRLFVSGRISEMEVVPRIHTGVVISEMKETACSRARNSAMSMEVSETFITAYGTRFLGDVNRG